MKKIFKLSSILLFILALLQGALLSVFDNDLYGNILYYILFDAFSFITFWGFTKILDIKILKISSILIGVFYPIFYSSAFVLSNVDFGRYENIITNFIVFFMFLVFFSFIVGLFKQIKIKEKNIVYLKIISIIHAICILVLPFATFITKLFFFGAIMSLMVYENKTSLLNGKKI